VFRTEEGYRKHSDLQLWELPQGGGSRQTNPHPEGKMEVTNPLAEKQKAKGLFSLTTKTGEIM